MCVCVPCNFAATADLGKVYLGLIVFREVGPDGPTAGAPGGFEILVELPSMQFRSKLTQRFKYVHAKSGSSTVQGVASWRLDAMPCLVLSLGFA